MAQRIPFHLDGQFVGKSEPSSFNRDGQTINVPAKLKFLVQRGPTGGEDVQLIEVSAPTLDRCTPPFDYASLTVGDRVLLAGEAVVQDRGSERDSFVAIQQAAMADAKVAPVRKAS